MVDTVKSTLPLEIANRQPPDRPSDFEGEMRSSLPEKDDRLTEGKIIRSLKGTGYLQLRDVKVCIDDGSIVLLGKVSSYYLKQLAQSIAMTIAERHELRNELDVVAPAHSRIAGPIR